MGRDCTLRGIGVSLLAFACLVVPAEAAVHLMKIEQVIGGVEGDSSAQAIQLRMRAAGQTVISSARIRAWDAAGANPVVVVDLTGTVPNGLSGDRILVATANFLNKTAPATVADRMITNPIPASYLAAGSLTFETDSGALIYWRLSWGGASYTGSTTGGIDNDADGEFGPPFSGVLPSSGIQALLFQGTASAPSTNNAANYALTAGAGVFTNNARNNFTLVVQSGACCDDLTGDCTEAQSETDCENGGGRYGGDGSTCVTINPPCTGPIGACCDDSTGICTEGQSQVDCENGGGRYGGDDSTCATINPPCVAATGACCNDLTGDCTEGMTQNDCASGGGRYGGDDSTCLDIDPPCLEPPLPIALEVVAGGLASPIHVTHAGDGSDRLFVVDQAGLIRVIDAGGNLLPTPFLDVTAKLPTLGMFFDERGLLGMAFHPNYEMNGRFFIRYSAPRSSTGTEPCDLSGFNPGCHKEVLAEYHVTGDPTTNNVADPGSEIILFEADEPQFNHNSGMVEFGPDGYLYFTLGDGGGANDGLADGDPPGSAPSHGPIGNGQNLETALGKVIRLDVDTPPTPPLPYAIPPSNPFVGVAGLDEIYAYGFRNPFRFSFDDGPGGTGELYVADVGQNLFEEVDIVELGGNYGWVIREGFECFDPFDPGTPPASCPTTGAMGEPLLDPVSVYSHAEGGLAIVGGYVYRGSRYPDLVGRYVYGDFSADFGPTGRIYYFDTTGPEAYVRREFIIAPDGSPFGLVLKGLGEDENNELYVAASVDLAPSGTSGVVMKLVPPPTAPAGEPGGLDKNRYISFVLPPPLDAGPGNETAIAVVMTSLHHPAGPPNAPNFTAFEGQVRYVNTFRDGSDNPIFDCRNSNSLNTFYKCARLGCQPEYRDWSAAIGSQTLHVTGAAVVPSSIYDVSQISVACQGSEASCAVASGSISVATGRWGDVLPGALGATDIAAVVDKAKDLPAAIPEFRGQLQGNEPDPVNTAVSAQDIAREVDAVKGFPYPFSGPPVCP